MIGKRLEAIRKGRGMSQRELAAILLARIFDVSMDYLLGLVDQPLSLSREEQTLLFPSSMTPTQREFLAELLMKWEAGADAASTVRTG